MHCPICNEALNEIEKGCYVCPNKDGILLSARLLSQKNKDFADTLDEASVSAATSDERQLVCPHCRQNMHNVDYNGTGIMIESCAACHYRWLDNGELRKIKDFVPTINHANAKDLLFLTQFEHENNSEHGINEKAPGYHSAVGGVIRGYAATDTRKTFAFMHASVISGIAKAMVHSKFWRIVGPIVIIAMCASVWLLVSKMRLIDFSMFDALKK